jgi:hypothetical protein
VSRQDFVNVNSVRKGSIIGVDVKDGNVNQDPLLLAIVVIQYRSASRSKHQHHLVSISISSILLRRTLVAKEQHFDSHRQPSMQ